MSPIDDGLAAVLPRSASVTTAGHLAIAGCDAVDLASEFGTPLYVFDEDEIRSAAREYREAFASLYAQSAVVYAAKALLGRWIAAIMAEEGLGMDVVSGGELAVARSAGFPMERVLFHGNNKSEQELREAVQAGVGRIVIDNFHELELLDAIAGEAGRKQPALLRVSPNVDAYTHAKTTTGTLDVKFGVALEAGIAEQAVVRAQAKEHIDLLGLHCHLGSPIYGLEPYRQANDVMIEFAAGMVQRHGMELREYNLGGGFAVAYTRDKLPPSPEQYAHAIADSLNEALERHELQKPMLLVEPGRSLVARAGVALYTIGARKEAPGVRVYVSVDGGMGDNIRPAMYDSEYEAVVANRMADTSEEKVTIAGKYCESGDILLRDVALPKLSPGDLIAMPAAGAYNIPMASNYNMSLKPAIVLLRDGHARLVRRRETYDDLLRMEVGE
jgi:diaminopimelate decarboxylase